MAIYVRCQGCGKSVAAPDHFAGKKVKCRCGAVFVVPIPATPPPAAGSLRDMLDEELAIGPKIEAPGQNAPSANAPNWSAGQAILPPVAPRRKSPIGGVVLKRLRERKLPAAVALAAIGLTVVFLVTPLMLSMPWLLVIPPLLGAALAVLGYWFPTAKRQGRRGAWLDPMAVTLAKGSGGIGLILGVLYGLMALSTFAGFPILLSMGFSKETAFTIAGCFLGIIGVFLGFAFLTLSVSLVASLVRRYGLPSASGIIYLVLAGSLLVFLAPQFLRALSFGIWRYGISHVDQQRQPFVQPMPAMPAGAARGTVKHFEPPPGASDPRNPDFYRVNLAELRSSDEMHRRVAAIHLAEAEPKELRGEITKALESLLHDPVEDVRDKILTAYCHWSDGDTLPIVLRAVEDPSFLVHLSAMEILSEKKDPRSAEPLVLILLKNPNMHLASCLEQMGSMVEDSLLRHIDTDNQEARNSIIDILGTVGTKKAVPKLREIAAGSDFSTSSRAQSALRQLGEKAQ